MGRFNDRSYNLTDSSLNIVNYQLRSLTSLCVLILLTWHTHGPDLSSLLRNTPSSNVWKSHMNNILALKGHLDFLEECNAYLLPLLL